LKYNHLFKKQFNHLRQISGISRASDNIISYYFFSFDNARDGAPSRTLEEDQMEKAETHPHAEKEVYGSLV